MRNVYSLMISSVHCFSIHAVDALEFLDAPVIGLVSPKSDETGLLCSVNCCQSAHPMRTLGLLCQHCKTQGLLGESNFPAEYITCIRIQKLLKIILFGSDLFEIRKSCWRALLYLDLSFRCVISS